MDFALCGYSGGGANIEITWQRNKNVTHNILHRLTDSKNKSSTKNKNPANHKNFTRETSLRILELLIQKRDKKIIQRLALQPTKNTGTPSTFFTRINSMKWTKAKSFFR